ncbi:hypothetical protein AMTRI_Chr07g25960 [Amborella trichopoda]
MVHSQILVTHLSCKSVLASKPIRALDARTMFDRLLKQTIYAYNCMLKAYIEQEQHHAAMVLYLQMVSGGILPDQFTLSFIVKACIGLRALHLGKLVHAHILVFGYDYDLYLATSLVEMYAKCHKIECAHLVFNKVSHGDIFLWTVLISGYLHIGDHECALNLLLEMGAKGIEANLVTWNTLISGCV